MENLEGNEKKSKRPRIGQPRPMASGTESGVENDEALSAQQNNYYEGRQQRPDYSSERSYRPRPYNNARQNDYQQRSYNNRQNDYQQRPYYNNNNNSEDDGYKPRQYNNRQQGGYKPRQYNNHQQQDGGYNQHGYNNRQQGGYQQRGYNQGNYQQRNYNNQEEGGYQPRQYNNRQQGGYQQRGYNNNGYRQQGGYNNGQRQGGYNNGNQRRPMRQNKYGMPQGGKTFAPRPKRVEYEMPVVDPNEQIRLNKFMANAGICSRREADEFIQQGLVKVNGNVVTELGTKISHSDTVEYDEKIVALERKCYILLNKPKDCVTTSDDPNGRLTVMDLVKGACDERIYPVGRLDRNTTGVLLLTNDGDLASKLTHPKYVKKKIYHVWTDKDISEDDMQRIADGIELEDGPIHADAISYATETDRNQAGIEIHSGRNRIVRRLFESLGYHVTKLDRVYFAGLTKKNLPRGRWRYLTQEEVNFLKMGSFE